MVAVAVVVSDAVLRAVVMPSNRVVLGSVPVLVLPDAEAVVAAPEGSAVGVVAAPAAELVASVGGGLVLLAVVALPAVVVDRSAVAGSWLAVEVSEVSMVRPTVVSLPETLVSGLLVAEPVRAGLSVVDAADCCVEVRLGLPVGKGGDCSTDVVVKVPGVLRGLTIVSDTSPPSTVLLSVVVEAPALLLVSAAANTVVMVVDDACPVLALTIVVAAAVVVLA